MINGSRNAEFAEALRDALALTLFLAMTWIGLAISQAWAEGLYPAVFCAPVA